MKFKTKEHLDDFLNDVPYFFDAEDYCLGNSLAEASSVFKELIKTKEKKDVGMDIKRG